MKKYLLIFTILLLGAFSAGAQNYDRGYETIPSYTFLKKGTWMAGGTFQYSQHINSDYNFLLINNINSDGYSFSINPKGMYMFRDNLGGGLKLSYSRSMLDVASGGLSISDISMNIKDCYQIQREFGAYAFFRAYIPFAGIKRFALYADLVLGTSFERGKMYNAGGDAVLGSFAKSYSLELAVDPGVIVFLTDRVALEMNVGIFKVSYDWTNQIHNQVYAGHSDSTSAGFLINLLSVGVGISYYFL